MKSKIHLKKKDIIFWQDSKGKIYRCRRHEHNKPVNLKCMKKKNDQQNS
jgi:hypothetical protein